MKLLMIVHLLLLKQQMERYYTPEILILVLEWDLLSLFEKQLFKYNIKRVERLYSMLLLLQDLLVFSVVNIILINIWTFSANRIRILIFILFERSLTYHLRTP